MDTERHPKTAPKPPPSPREPPPANPDLLPAAEPDPEVAAAYAAWLVTQREDRR